MRSTKASAVVDRLKRRTGDSSYSMSTRADGRFALFVVNDGVLAAVGEPLPLDDFVVFVNAHYPEKPKPVSKLDAAFREQLKKR